MFSIFTTRGGKALIVRAVDIRSFEDVNGSTCTLIWEPTPGQLMDREIADTAVENLNRLKQEETEALIAAEKLRQRQAQQIDQANAVQRGRQSMRMVTK